MSLQLPDNCRTGKISVHPLDWDRPSADVSIEWYIHYRFHDPRFKAGWPKGYPVKVRNMNDCHQLKKRQLVTQKLLENEKANLLRGFNPLGRAGSGFEISPSTGLAAGLQKGFELLPASITKDKIENALVHIQLAISGLRYGGIPVGTIRQHHLEVIFLKIAKNKEEEYEQLRKIAAEAKKKPIRAIPDKWGPEAFNSYRAYLQMLFKQIKKVGGTEVKPVDDIEKRKGIKKLRTGITADEFGRINDHLKPNYYTFWRLIHMFFPSGSRETEFIGVQKEHVDLANQRFRVLVKKGSCEWEWMWKTITKKALPLWQEVMGEAKAGNFLFSEDLQPGAVRISARQLTIRWKRHVKVKLGIRADFYELKHQFTTKVITMALKKIDEATKVAADINGHKSNDMEKMVYDLEAGERLHRELKDSTAGLQ